jgi:hypothetical protein
LAAKTEFFLLSALYLWALKLHAAELLLRYTFGAVRIS